MRKRGFTLIELLIVVAIIAILAAIAIPNFLQAQTRAKVSRVQADMRSIATGLESYYVDHNEYIPDYKAVFDGDLRYGRYLPRFVHLTTPIAYLSSIPGDPFAEGPASSEDAELRGPYTEDWPNTDGPLDSILAFDYAQHYQVGDYTNSAGFRAVARSLGAETDEEASAMASQIAWALRSVGPDGESVPLGYSVEAGAVQYDPTNGTISTGQIYRTNLRQH